MKSEEVVTATAARETTCRPRFRRRPLTIGTTDAIFKRKRRLPKRKTAFVIYIDYLNKLLNRLLKQTVQTDCSKALTGCKPYGCSP